MGERVRDAAERDAEAPDRPVRPPAAPVAASVGQLARADLHTRARTIGMLQRGAGNAAVSRALGPTVARSLTAEQANHISGEVHEGVSGWGTDEDRIYRAMGPVTAADIPQLAAAYRARFRSELLIDLRDDLSDDEIQANIPAMRRSGAVAIAFELQQAMSGVGTDEDRIYRALSGITNADLPPIEAAYRARTNRHLRADLQDELTREEFRRLPVYQAVGLDAVAQQVHDAVEGLGTDETAIYGALAGRTQQQIDAIAAAYLRMYRRPMIDDLRDDLSDGEMRRLATLSPTFAPQGAAGPGGAAEQIAVQLRDAMAGLGTNEEGILAALSNRSAAEIVAIKAAYRALTGRELEADLRDDLSGDELRRALAQLGIVEAVREQNTELGGMIFGNFDFQYSGAAVVITVRLKFEFRDDVPAAERAPFKQRFMASVRNTWQNPPMGLHGEGPCPHPDISITVNAIESESNPHKVVDVTNDARREHVIFDVNVSKHTDDATIAHEFGHVLGLCDEYDGGWLENLMFWHANRAEDPHSIMNMGTEYRPRHFENIRQRVQATAPPGCVYHIVRTR